VAKADSTRKSPALVHDSVRASADCGADRLRHRGFFSRRRGWRLKPLGDAFVSLIRMMIAPVIFLRDCAGNRFDERPEEGRKPSA